MTKENHEQPLLRHSGEGRNPVISTNWTPACASLEHYSDDQIARWNVEDTLNIEDRKRILGKLQRKLLVNNGTQADRLPIQTVSDFLAGL